MHLIIRPTLPEEYAVTEHITREAFWDVYKPGADEHLILHQLRKSPCHIPELDLVAVLYGEVLGHAISTRARVQDDNNFDHEVLCVGPVCVRPDNQQHGIGSALMRKSMARAREMGFSGMILFGNPDYYHRFGFRNAADYGITTKEGTNFEPFMALVLAKNGFKNIRGRFFEDPAFEVNEAELEVFDENFPSRRKHITETQLK
jgi:predicted N-acetyltransferase YhbS